MPSPSESATPYRRIAVLGAGAWGTALALVAARAGRQTILWARDGAEKIAAARANARYLPGIALPPDLAITGTLADAMAADAILLAVPAQSLHGFAATLAPLLPRDVPLLVCAKGMERATGRLVQEILAEILPDAEIAILSGPSFARDVASDLPTAVTIAARGAVAARLQASLSSAAFRPYASDDLAGVALGGAAKNVYAIACGVVEGMHLGENARAALLARSFAELARLGEALGARRETLMGLSGLGDLVLTATSVSSRNFAFGIALGRGAVVGDIAGPDKPLAEGVATAPALVARAARHGVELPIGAAVADLLSGALPLNEAVTRLMRRRLKAE